MEKIKKKFEPTEKIPENSQFSEFVSLGREYAKIKEYDMEG